MSSDGGPARRRAAADAAYAGWLAANAAGDDALRAQRAAALAAAAPALISVVTPVWRPAPHMLRDMLDSVCAQSYPHWELCLGVAPGEYPHNASWIAERAAADPRIRVVALERNAGIGANTNRILDAARGSWIAFLDHDDELTPDALYEVAQRFAGADLVYSDFDYLDEQTGLCGNPLFKPAWSPELLYSANYLTHLTVVRRELLEAVGGLAEDLDGAQDWDLHLRLSERTARIEHVPRVLYHWRRHAGSTAASHGAKAGVGSAQTRSLDRHFARRDLPAQAEIDAQARIRIRWRWPSRPRVSIVIPTKDKVELLRRALRSILARSSYPNYEILVIDTGSREDATFAYYEELRGEPRVRLLTYELPFNWSAVNNVGAAATGGEVLVFLNNDVEVIAPDWLDELVGWALHPQIGPVGALLLRENGLVQHAGIALGLGGFADHPFADEPPETGNAHGTPLWYRDYLAVTGACMAVRRAVYDQAGGFDEAFILCGSDVAFCLEARRLGYRTVYTPYARLYHLESATRGSAIPPSDFAVSFAYYRHYLRAGDPYLSPNLSRWHKPLAPRDGDEKSPHDFGLELMRGRQPAPPPVPSEAELAAQWFDADDATFARALPPLRSRRQTVRRIAWFLPTFGSAAFGGVATILRFAAYFSARHGVRNHFVFCGNGDYAHYLTTVRARIPELSEDDITILSSAATDIDIPPTDAAICTLWTTAFPLMRYRGAARKFYFIQDWESGFYPDGTLSALVETSYRMGFYGLANTISLARSYRDEYGATATWFTPAVDRGVYHPTSRDPAALDPLRTRRAFVYARPDTPRNGFELLCAAASVLKARLGERIEILAAGGEFDPARYGVEGAIRSLGLLPFEQTPALYRSCDVGVALMMTRHPSYIPFELMASGCAVVANLNPWNAWFYRDGENALLALPTASSLADAIERVAFDDELRMRLVAGGLRTVAEHSDWVPEMEHAYEFLCDPEHAARDLGGAAGGSALSDPGAAFA